MAIYSTNFSGYTVDVQPSDWAARWVTADNNWLTKSKAATDGGKVLENTGTVDGRHLLSWDAIDADVNRADVEILARVRTSSTVADQFRLTVRGSGAAGAETGYNLLFNSISNVFRLHKYVAGASTNIGNALTYAYAVNTFYYVKFRVSGSSLMGKVWLDDGLTLEPDWQVTATDTAITAAGWVGVGNFESTGTRDIDFISVATNGDSAPFVTNPATVVKTSQVVLEAAYEGGTETRFSQLVFEVALGAQPNLLFSQAVLEVAFLDGAAPASTQQPKMIFIC